MGLLSILYYLTSFIAGFAVIFLSYRLQKSYDFRFLTDYFYFLLAAVVYGFFNWTGPHLVINIMTHIPEREYFRIILIFGALGMPFLLAKIYFLMALIFRWLGIKKSRILLSSLTILMLSMSLLYYREINSYFKFGIINLGRGAIFLVGLASVVVQLIILLAALLPQKTKDVPPEYRGLRPFALISILCFITYSLSAYTRLNFLSPLLYFLFLFPPLVFLKLFLVKNRPPLRSGNDSLEAMASRYGLTSREKDIVHFVLKGYSNRQIEKRLFISQKTIKNNLTRIFRKSGVSSRSELISLLLHTYPPVQISSPE